jgi:hypothetical protein
MNFVHPAQLLRFSMAGVGVQSLHFLVEIHLIVKSLLICCVLLVIHHHRLLLSNLFFLIILEHGNKCRVNISTSKENVRVSIELVRVIF